MSLNRYERLAVGAVVAEQGDSLQSVTVGGQPADLNECHRFYQMNRAPADSRVARWIDGLAVRFCAGLGIGATRPPAGSAREKVANFVASERGRQVQRFVTADAERIVQPVALSVTYADGRSEETTLSVTDVSRSLALQRASLLTEMGMVLPWPPFWETALLAVTSSLATLASALAVAMGDLPLAKACLRTARKHVVLGLIAIPPVGTATLAGAVAAVADATDIGRMTQKPSMAQMAALAHQPPTKSPPSE